MLRSCIPYNGYGTTSITHILMKLKNTTVTTENPNMARSEKRIVDAVTGAGALDDGKKL